MCVLLSNDSGRRFGVASPSAASKMCEVRDPGWVYGIALVVLAGQMQWHRISQKVWARRPSLRLGVWRPSTRSSNASRGTTALLCSTAPLPRKEGIDLARLSRPDGSRSPPSGDTISNNRDQHATALTVEMSSIRCQSW